MADESRQFYSVPDVESLEFMDASEAQTKVKEFQSATFSDKSHPYLTPGHPLHKDYVAFAQKLYEKAAENRENPCDVILREHAAEQEREDEKLRAEAEKLIDSMDESGFFTGRERLDLDDIQPWKIELWKMQFLNAQGDFKTLLPKLEEHIQKLSLSGVDAFRNLVWDEKASDGDKAHMVRLLLKRIWSESEKRFSVDRENLAFGGKKRKSNITFEE